MGTMVNAKKVDASTGEVFEVRNPATGEVIGMVPRAGWEDVHLALEIARCGKPIMAALPAHRRSEILRKTAELMGDQLECLSQLLTSENGKTIRQCRFEMATTQRLFGDFAQRWADAVACFVTPACWSQLGASDEAGIEIGLRTSWNRSIESEMQS